MPLKTQLLVEFPLQIGVTAYVNVRSDYVEYFGIVVPNQADLIKIRPPRRGVGKKILVPSELFAAKGSFRYATIHVPNQANLVQVAVWINTKFVSHKPNYFLTPSGQRHLVNIALSADTNQN